MKPSRAILIVGATWATIAGCTGRVIRPQSPDDPETPESRVDLIGDMAHPYGMDYVKVEGVSLVTGLDGTGADPAPGPQRAALMAEMQRRIVDQPTKILASPDTALVLVRGFLRPGMQKGDPFDVEVRIPSRSQSQSLRGGWLLSTQLAEMAVLGQQIRQGHRLALAEGPVLVDPTAKSDEDRPLLTQGRVLGGGVASKTRNLGLAIDTIHQSISTSQKIGTAINRRFHTYVRGVKQGVANPKTDRFVELLVHPRYKDNITRYMLVVRSIALKESAVQHQHRLLLLSQQLTDPVTTATAALRLEAIGDEGREILQDVMLAEGQDPEVRFFAAEALAYLDETVAVEQLALAARDEPAFRLHALAALSAMDDVNASDALRELLNASSAETRYGAFRALSAMRSTDPVVRGEELGGQFHYHLLDVEGPPMIHVTRSYRPELVLFGRNQSFNLPLVVDAGSHIMVNGLSGTHVTVSRFTVGEPVRKRVVSSNVDAVVRAIVELGGTYPDVVQALHEAKQSGALASRWKVDALPEAGRRYQRAESTDEFSEVRMFQIANPLPDLFLRWQGSGGGKEKADGPEGI